MKEMAAMEEGERKKLGFEWVEMLEEGLIVGEVKEVAEKQGVKGERRGGYWYQREGVEGEKDRKAESGEKVLLHFHGKYAFVHFHLPRTDERRSLPQAVGTSSAPHTRKAAASDPSRPSS